MHIGQVPVQFLQEDWCSEPSTDDSSDDSSVSPLSIPFHVKVHVEYVEIDGIPGLCTYWDTLYKKLDPHCS